VSFLETVNSSEISERFANYIIRGNYPDFLSIKVIINNHEPKNIKKNRENEVSFLKTENRPETSERFANYIIRGNYRNFLSKKVTTNYLDKKKSKKFRN